MHLLAVSQWQIDLDRYLNRIVPKSPIHYLPYPIAHFLGYRNGRPRNVGNVVVAFWALVGAFVGVVSIEAMFRIPEIRRHGPPLVIASFGAGAILEYNTIESPLAQPRNSILGHFLATVIGIAITKAFRLSSDFENLRWLAGGLSCGVASASMTLTGTIYPPAGATALLAAVDPTVERLGWYLLPLVILSSALTLVISLLVNNIQRRYPTYWWTPVDLSARKVIEGTEHPTPEKIVGVSPTSTVDSPKQSLNIIRHDIAAEVGRNGVFITPEHISVPEGMLIAFEEGKILQILQARLAQGSTDSLEKRDPQIQV